jgi:glycosyltransferase involved in cell wall biosynthesis
MGTVARCAWGSALVARASAKADVVYSTGLYGRTRVGTLLTGKPRVLKLTGDPAYERAARFGLTGVALDDFQRAHGIRVEGLKALRDATLSGARRYLCPSSSLAGFAAEWRGGRRRPRRGASEPRRGARARQPRRASPPARPRRTDARLRGPARAVKSLDSAIEALRQVDGVSLLIAGDGPERAGLERFAGGLPVRFLGPSHARLVLELFAAADAVLLPSSWENFPHAVVEGLAVGTPVIATAVGGVTEIVTDGVNGLLVPRGDVGAMAEAIRRFFGDDALRERLRGAAAGSVGDYAPERVYGRIEELLREAAA